MSDNKNKRKKNLKNKFKRISRNSNCNGEVVQSLWIFLGWFLGHLSGSYLRSSLWVVRRPSQTKRGLDGQRFSKENVGHPLSYCVVCIYKRFSNKKQSCCSCGHSNGLHARFSSFKNQPFQSQYQDANSLFWSPYILSSTSWENLFIHQDSSSLVMISLILMTCMFYNALIWWGEI